MEGTCTYIPMQCINIWYWMHAVAFAISFVTPNTSEAIFGLPRGVIRFYCIGAIICMWIAIHYMTQAVPSECSFIFGPYPK